MRCARNLGCNVVSLIKNLSLSVALGIALFSSCTKPSQPDDSASALLKIPVHAKQPQPYAEFNSQIAVALHGETWPKEAMLVALRFASWGTNRMGVLSWQGTGERPSHYHIVAINDNLLDDAVRGRRLALDIERQPDDSWRVVDAQLSWRCWRKASNDSFGVDDCP